MKETETKPNVFNFENYTYNELCDEIVNSLKFSITKCDMFRHWKKKNSSGMCGDTWFTEDYWFCDMYGDGVSVIVKEKCVKIDFNDNNDFIFKDKTLFILLNQCQEQEKRVNIEEFLSTLMYENRIYTERHYIGRTNKPEIDEDKL